MAHGHVPTASPSRRAHEQSPLFQNNVFLGAISEHHQTRNESIQRFVVVVRRRRREERRRGLAHASRRSRGLQGVRGGEGEHRAAPAPHVFAVLLALLSDQAALCFWCRHAAAAMCCSGAPLCLVRRHAQTTPLLRFAESVLQYVRTTARNE